MTLIADLRPGAEPMTESARIELLKQGSLWLSAFDRSAGRVRECRVRLLKPADLDQLIALNRLLVAGLPHPHVFRAYPDDFMEMNIVDRGRTIGVLCEDRLIAHATLFFPGDDPANFGHDIALPPDALVQVAHLDGSGVHPDFRGSSIQRTLNRLRCAYAERLGYVHMMVTVSPLNPYSLRNHMLGTGLTIRAATLKYGGMERFTLYRDVREPVAPPPHSGITVGLTDFARHRTLLADGWIGASFFETGSGGHAITYEPRRRFPETERTLA